MASRRKDVGTPGFALDLASTKAAPEEFRLALLSYLEPFELGPRVINRLEVILEELVTNVVRHSATADRIAVEAGIDEQGLVLIVMDNGEAFNPLDVTEPAPFTTLESATLGGQGMPLIRRLTKSVHYDYVDGRNRMTTVMATK